MVGECRRADCKCGHPITPQLLFELAKRWLLEKEFTTVKKLIFLVASKSSPFRESLWSDEGQEVVNTVVSALLNVSYT